MANNHEMCQTMANRFSSEHEANSPDYNHELSMLPLSFFDGNSGVCDPQVNVNDPVN